MAKINLPFNDVKDQALQPAIPFDQGTINKALNAQTDGLNQLAHTTMKMADDYKYKQEKASFSLAAAKNAASLGNMLAVGGKEIGDALEANHRKLIELDHKQTKLTEARETDVYMLTGLEPLKEELMFRMEGVKKSVKEGKPKNTDPLGAMDWFRGKQEQLLGQAPNETAKMAMAEKLSALGLQVLSQTLAARRAAAANGRAGGTVKFMKGLQKQQNENPYANASQFVDQLNKAGDVMKKDGFDPAKIGELVKNSTSTLFKSKIDGLTTYGDYKSAIGVLASAEGKKYLNKVDYGQSAMKTAQTELAARLTSNKNTKQALVLNAVVNNDLSQGSDGQQAASKMLWDTYVMNVMPETRDATPKDVDSIANRFIGFHQQQRTVSEDALNNIFQTIQHSPNPSESAGFATGIAKMFDGSPASAVLREAANNIYKTNKDVVHYSKFVDARLKVGATPEKAIQEARDFFDSRNVGLRTEKETRFAEIVKDSNYSSKALVQDALGSGDGWKRIYNTVNAVVPGQRPNIPLFSEAEKFGAEAEANAIFKNAYLQTGDEKIAKDLTTQYLKANYRETQINGRIEISKMAPEAYYSGEMLDKFYQGVNTRVEDFAKNIGAELKASPIGKTIKTTEYSGESFNPNPDSSKIAGKVAFPQTTSLPVSKETTKYVEPTSKDGFVLQVGDKEVKMYVTPVRGITNDKNMKENDLNRSYIFTYEDGTPVLIRTDQGEIQPLDFSLGNQDQEFAEHMKQKHAEIKDALAKPDKGVISNYVKLLESGVFLTPEQKNALIESAYNSEEY